MGDQGVAGRGDQARNGIRVAFVAANLAADPGGNDHDRIEAIRLLGLALAEREDVLATLLGSDVRALEVQIIDFERAPLVRRLRNDEADG